MDKSHAIKTANEIIEIEDFSLEVVPYTPDGTEQDNDFEAGQKVFRLIDNSGANWGQIEHERFDNLASIIDRLEIYHGDFLEPFEGGGGYPELLAFINDDEATKVLFECSPEDYEKYLTADKTMDSDMRYYSLYTKEDLQDLTDVLQAFDEGNIVADKNNWQIARGGYDLEFTVSYQNEPIFDCIDHQLKPYTENASKIMELMPIIDTITEEYKDVSFDPAIFGIMHIKSAVRSNYEQAGKRLTVLVDDYDHVMLGESQNYDSHGNYNNQNDSLIMVTDNPQQGKDFYHLLHGAGSTADFNKVEELQLYGGLRNISDFLRFEEKLLDKGIQKTQEFTLAGVALTQDSFNDYVGTKHPEFKAYQDKLKTYIAPYGVPQHDIPAIDVKIAKEMQKEHYSKDRIAAAVEFGSPYSEKDSAMRKGYAQDVLKGKFKESIKGTYR